jgi:hypothetical protein
MDIGLCAGAPVDDAARQVPFALTGTIDSLTRAVGRPALGAAHEAAQEAARKEARE